MPDIYMDVDVALASVPVNILPLLDDTDFKTRETAVAYNAAGMDLVWNFTTTAGVTTQTAVTPTTGGNYDWTNLGDGMYAIEIPASGGASINNDTEGFGWFTGVATGVLPWRGPTIGFRAAGLNNALIDSAYSTTQGLAGTNLDAAITSRLAPTVAARTLDVSANGNAGIDWANIDAPTTAQNLSGTNIDVDQVVASVSGAVGSVTAGVTVTTNNDKTGYGLSATAIQAIWDALTAALTTVGSIGKLLVDNINATISSRLASASITLTGGAVTVGTNNDKTGYSIGVGGLANTGFAASAIDSSALAASAGQEIADEVLNRDIAGGGSGNTRNVRNALRAIRNRVDGSTGTLTVYQEDDTTPAWTAALTRSAVNPIVEINP